MLPLQLGQGCGPFPVATQMLVQDSASQQGPQLPFPLVRSLTTTPMPPVCHAGSTGVSVGLRAKKGCVRAGGV